MARKAGGKTTPRNAPRSARSHLMDVRVFSREAIRRLDQRAVQEHHIPAMVLMENAARCVAGATLELLARKSKGAIRRSGRVLLCVGTGNKGGDAMAAARHLANAGVSCTLLFAAAEERCKGEGAAQLMIVRTMGITRTRWRGQKLSEFQADVIVDGLLGTGLTSPATAEAGALIRAVNSHATAARTPVLAIDIPSGLDADLGIPAEGADVLRANLTVTFCGLKRGMLAPSAVEFVGEVEVGDIGVPRSLVEELGETIGE